MALLEGGAAGAVRRSWDVRVDGLLSGEKWRSDVISYGDPQRSRDYGRSFDNDDDGDGISVQFDGFEPLSATQFAFVQAALDTDHDGAIGALAGFAVEGFSRLKLDYAGAASAEAQIRLANSDDPATAYAWYPGGRAQDGSVWFGPSGRFPELGNYDLFTIAHELGHALGLKHPHERAAFDKLPRGYDSPEFTVMTYRNYVGDNIRSLDSGEYLGLPQSFMMLDVAALQHMYGANFKVNSEDTTYSWHPKAGVTRVNGEVALEPGMNRIFATIWDGGGIDTYDLSAYRADLVIDLRPGAHSVFSDRQLVDLGGGPNGGFARGNIFNALQYQNDARSLIENARGGGGYDTMHGNAGDNVLWGGRGGDVLYGHSGDDRLNGGASWDYIVGGRGADLLRGGYGQDYFTFRDARDSRGSDPDHLAALGNAPAFSNPGRKRGDVIDLSLIDADSTRPGDQSFRFGDATSKGWLWLTEKNGDTHVNGNMDDDDWAEFKLVIEDGETLAEAYSAEDFLL